MRVLIDTQVVLWTAAYQRQLSVSARAALADPENERLLSAIVPWEIAIKIGTGKLLLPLSVPEFIDYQTSRLGLVHLPIVTRHSIAVANLPQFRNHKDPFDRMLIAQALTEGVPIVTADRRFAQYGVQVIW